jgi:cyclopropane fatty-acyl-phospholipid synthase-like methyltransferase
MKPFAESCEENKTPILQVLMRLFADTHSVLEIGSGTGQHAVHFAAAMPHLIWQTSEVAAQHAGIHAWLDEATLVNLRYPLDLDVRGDWPDALFEGVFSANTAHIMSWPEVEYFFKGVGRVLAPEGIFALYGPFNYAGEYSSESNRRFDGWLKARDPLSGIRDFAALNALAEQQDMVFCEDVEMPVNNRILVWRKT